MMPDRHFKEGDVVMIYHDTETEKKPEAKAELMELLIPARRGRTFELWDVLFVNSGFRAQRAILVKDPAKAKAEEMEDEAAEAEEISAWLAPAATPSKPAATPKGPDHGLAPAATTTTREATVHHVRRSLISIDPRLEAVPMMGAVGSKFLGSAKPEVRKVGQELTDEAAALFASLEELGILEPIKAYRRGRRWVTVDGRHRMAGSKQTRIPLIEVSEEEAMQIIEGSVIGRRHWTKGQRAWLGVCQHPEVCDVEAKDSLKQVRSDSVGTVGLNATSLAKRLGVSADVVSQAVTLYRAFRAPGFPESSPEAIEAAACAESYEHLIWGGAGLGAILAGIAGGEKTVGQPKLPTGFHHLVKPLDELKRLSKAFVTWNDEERAKASRLLTLRVKEDMTPEFRLVLAEAIAAADI